MMTNAALKLPAFTALGAAGCLFGLALERPEPVLLGAPFLVVLVIGVALMRPFDVQVSARLLNDRVNEGDDVKVGQPLFALDRRPLESAHGRRRKPCPANSLRSFARHPGCSGSWSHRPVTRCAT